MKRRISVILSLIMLLTCLISCGSGTSRTTQTTQTTQTTAKPKIPENYTMYVDGMITFAYPKNWTRKSGTVVELDSKSSNNNITVANEPKNVIYDTMTVEYFNKEIKPVYDEIGFKVSNVKIERWRTNGEKVTIISYDAKYRSMSMKQTQFVMHSGSRTFVVTVSIYTPESDPGLVQTVYDTLDVYE